MGIGINSKFQSDWTLYKNRTYIYIYTTSITNSIETSIEHWNLFSTFRKKVDELLVKSYPDISLEFRNLEIRYFVRGLTKLSYPDFLETLKKKNIHKLYPAKCDNLLSRLSIFSFNISKFTYWKIIRFIKYNTQ